MRHYRRASNVIADFDEKTSLGRTRQYKFGLLEQRRGQFTEEEVFGNTAASPALDTFLAMLGETVQLRGHRGYSGGLDTRHDQTGRVSLYTRHRGAEVMFHVAHYLPHRSAAVLTVVALRLQIFQCPRPAAAGPQAAHR